MVGPPPLREPLSTVSMSLLPMSCNIFLPDEVEGGRKDHNVTHDAYTRNTLDVDFMIAAEHLDDVRRIMMQAGFTNYDLIRGQVEALHTS